MRVAALISGGKDSCFNLMHCVAEGHNVVALANLRPADKDELDSYMYQTVGHQAVALYADAMGLPLYRREILGSAVELGANYQVTENDEVEDLFQLLAQIKEELDIDAVSVGAILSDYQRVRVENVCSRLSLTALAFLWRRDQTELLAEMIDCHVDAIVIKVAALGLTPKDHLGKTIKTLRPHLLRMNELYGLNVCGEGGEYETFTLDCPLFVRRIVVDEWEMVMHSDDAFAPVAYLNLVKMHLEDKPLTQNVKDILFNLPLKHSRHLMSELFPERDKEQKCEENAAEAPSLCDNLSVRETSHEIEFNSHSCSKRKCPDGFVFISGLISYRAVNGDISAELEGIFELLKHSLTEFDLSFEDLVSVHLYVANIKDFAAINKVYGRFFSLNPPVRVCVEIPLPENVSLSIDCAAFDGRSVKLDRRCMHVQGISHWAPANIGPYSQSIMLGQHVFIAGQIALCPATMTLAKGGGQVEARLSLRHVDRILKATNVSLSLRHLTLVICYVTDVCFMPSALEELHSIVDANSDCFEPLVVCVRVPALPRLANIEWEVVAVLSENSLECVETSTIKSGYVYRSCAKKHLTLEESVIFPFTISVDYVEDKVKTEVTLHEVTFVLLQQLTDILKRQNLNSRNLHSLRLFYSFREFNYTDLQRSYAKAFCSLIECSSEEIPTTFVPVCGFQSPNCLILLCHV